MSANQQAYTGMAGLADTTSEWNRMQFAIRAVLNQTVTATIVQVKAVGNGTVDVQPTVAQVDGAGNAVPHGTIHGLPVWALQGGTSGVIITPAVGDLGLAIFAHTDISNVKRAKKPTTPGSARRYDWSDGIYLGGVLNAAPTQYVRLNVAGIAITSPTAITLDAPSVKINGTEFSTHHHSGVATGTGNTGNVV